MEVSAALIAQADKSNSSYSFLFAVVVGTVVLLYFTRRKSTRTDSSLRTYARQQRDEFSSRRGLESDLREIMIELESLAREVNAQIDTKFHKLEAVMRDADRRIGKLEHLLEDRKPQDEKQPALDVTIGDDSPANPGVSSIDEADGIDRTTVHRLADAGRSPEDIARQLGRPMGEVELILAVRGRQATGST